MRDTGPGIAAEQMQQLFVPFDRLGAERTSAVAGTGLGLALSKTLVEAMQGSLTLQSEVGQGSTFVVELPIAAMPAETSIPVREIPDAQHTVLYIEDNLSNIALIEMLLRSQEHINLLTATSGNTGLNLAFERKPSLIVLDLHLPDIMGDEVLRRLQADSLTRDIPVVVLSADATPGQIEHLLACGAEAYLTKPLDVKQFLNIVNETITNSPVAV